MLNVNDISVDKIVINKDEIPNNRAKLDTGPLCNYQCEFCYYIDRLSERTHVDVVKQRADELLAQGITQVDLSGGESSISPDWFDILDYCNERFEHVSCLSHGGKFSDIEFLRKSQEHGLKEVLFSLHGATPEVHDNITNRKQSFFKIIQAIRNAKELGIVVRLNCTVYDKNYKDLPNIYADLVNDLDPLEVNFITLNYWEKATGEVPEYSVMTTAIQKCIDKLNVRYINVRYTPYCYMKGYEKYVCDQYQHIFDIYDWNKGVYSLESGTLLERSYDMAKVDRLKYYTKPKECLKCSHFYICDGIENQLADKVKVKPIEGERITDVVHHRRSFYES